MPTYEYRCTACAHEFEEFQSITAPSLTKCPACGKKSLERLIGVGGGIIFKGGGFYETDYRSDSYNKAAEAEKKSESGGGASGECCPCGKKPAEQCASGDKASAASGGASASKPAEVNTAKNAPSKVTPTVTRSPKGSAKPTKSAAGKSAASKAKSR